MLKVALNLNDSDKESIVDSRAGSDNSEGEERDLVSVMHLFKCCFTARDC
jgi:hypothetical protein